MSTPIEFLYLTMRNFLSYGNNRTTLNLRFDEPTLVVGRNLDDMTNGQMESNGAGKTTLINALAWVIYDKTVTPIKKDKLVNFVNKKNMEVILIFKKNNKFYKIHRYRKNSSLGGDGVRIYESDNMDFDTARAEDPSRADISEDSIRLGTKQIERIVGMPFEIFVRIVIYSGSMESFLSLPVTSATAGVASQSKIIEELFGLIEITDKAKVLKDEMKEDKDNLESLKKIGEEITKQRVMHQTQLDSVKNRIDVWEKNKDELIETLKNKINSLSETDFEYQEVCFKEIKKVEDDISEASSTLKLKASELRNANTTVDGSKTWQSDKDAKLSSISAKLGKFEEKDFDAEIESMTTVDNLKSQINELKNEARDFNKLTADADREMSKIADEREHLDGNKCPYCLQQMGMDSVKEKIANLDIRHGAEYKISATNIKKFKAHQESIGNLSVKVEELEEMISFKSISELNRYRSDLNDLKKELEFTEKQENPYTDIDSIKGVALSLEKQIVKLEAKLEKLKKKSTLLNNEIIYKSYAAMVDDRSKIDSLKNDLLKEEASINPHTDTLNDLKKFEIDDKNSKEIDALEKVLFHKTFLHKLLTKPDSFIRKTLLNQNLPFLNKQLKSYLDMLNLPHKVEFTEKLTADISKFGNEWDSDNLSRGQKARVDIALSFAFRDVLQKRYGKIPFCVLDECLDNGLSPTGAQHAAKMIKKIAERDKISMLLVTHREEITTFFDHTLEIELERGFSRILDSRISETTSA